uniref:Uncharacterized protein n=1 Tax=Astyanax mexicanus TaxID=7994 RepID=A0A8B9JE94_ASTMX
IEAIISAAETGFTGSLVGSKLTIFLVSIPSEHSSVLLPKALWMSCSCRHTSCSTLQDRYQTRDREKALSEGTSSPTGATGASGKLTRKSFSSRVTREACRQTESCYVKYRIFCTIRRT